jgi:hypothetical protein
MCIKSPPSIGENDCDTINFNREPVQRCFPVVKRADFRLDDAELDDDARRVGEGKKGGIGEQLNLFRCGWCDNPSEPLRKCAFPIAEASSL